MPKILRDNYYLLLVFGTFLIGIFLRPALPIDETRYLSVAWELWLSGEWFNLTVNFTPYHHKPPMLFWLMNISWHIFGLSRWAATLPPILSAMAVVWLTRKLAAKLFPGQDKVIEYAPLLMLASLPFLIYGSLIMFDMMLTVFVLLALLSLLEYAEKRKFKYMVAFGLFMGLGVLTKGPVVYIYTLFPALMGPLWLGNPRDQKNFWGWAMPCLGALLISGIPVLFWLVPMAMKADGNFLYWLLWEQTAGRVSGSFSAAHERPFWFYMPLVPLFFAPWILFPSFWRGLKKHHNELKQHHGLRFILYWILGGFFAFSFLISGKQPHYLVPLLPGVILFIAYFMQDFSRKIITRTVIASCVLFICAHLVAMKIYTPLFDWRPVAAFIAQHPHKDLAFVRSYHGEIGFYARLDRKVESLERDMLPEWFAKHPGGLAIVRYKTASQLEPYNSLFSMPYSHENRYIGVFSAQPE